MNDKAEHKTEGKGAWGVDNTRQESNERPFWWAVAAIIFILAITTAFILLT